MPNGSTSFEDAVESFTGNTLQDFLLLVANSASRSDKDPLAIGLQASDVNNTPHVCLQSLQRPCEREENAKGDVSGNARPLRFRELMSVSCRERLPKVGMLPDLHLGFWPCFDHP